MNTNEINAYTTDAAPRSREHDQLARWSFAQRIADTLAQRSAPESLVIGISGKWGEGKTTVLNFIRQRLAEYEQVVAVDFNPWLYRGEQHLIISFFNQLASALQGKLRTNSNKVGELLRKYGSGLGALPAALSTLMGLPGLAAILGKPLSDAATQWGADLAQVDVDDLRKRLTGLLANEGKRVVVLMDDIDRLDREETQAIFKLLKVVADFDWTSYVVAFDAEMVAAALGEKYGGTSEAGSLFLEKIVQVPLQLPKVPREVLRRFALEGVSRVLQDAQIELPDAEARRYVRSFDSHVLDRIDTPRSAKRYVNAIEFAIPLLRGEANIIDVLLIEALRTFHPKLYETARKNRDIFLGENLSSWDSNEKLQQRIAPGFAGLTADEADRAQQLLRDLFPRLSDIYASSRRESSWAAEWTTQKRVTSPVYFERYFSYGIPIGDFADSEIDELVQTSIRDRAQVISRVGGLLEQGEEKLLSKLQQRLAERAEEEKAAMAHVLAAIAHKLNNPPAGLPFLSPLGHAALIVANLLGQLGQRAMGEARTIIETSDLRFATNCIRWLHPPEGDSAASWPFEKSDMDVLLRILAQRIATEASVGPLFVKFPEEGFHLLAVWKQFGDEHAVRKHVRAAIQDNAPNAIQLLRAHAPTSINLGSGTRHYQPLSKEAYAALRDLVDIDDLLTLLLEAFPGANRGQTNSLDSPPSDQALVCDLLRLHAQATTAPTSEAGLDQASQGGASSPPTGEA